MGDVIRLINIVIFAVAAWLLSVETALYAMITYLAASKTVDFVVEGIEEYTGIRPTKERERFKQPIRAQFEAFASPYNFASNLWCDMVIDPLETRDTLALLFELAGRQPQRETRFGVFRM